MPSVLPSSTITTSASAGSARSVEVMAVVIVPTALRAGTITLIRGTAQTLVLARAASTAIRSVTGCSPYT